MTEDQIKSIIINHMRYRRDAGYLWQGKNIVGFCVTYDVFLGHSTSDRDIDELAKALELLDNYTLTLNPTTGVFSPALGHVKLRISIFKGQP